MPMRGWEIAAAAGFLALCLAVGIVVSRYVAPKPVIGFVRFDQELKLDAANQLISLIEAARQDSQVAGVVLEVMSPGGYATSSESVFHSLLRLRAEKPLVVVVDSLAASGGYYIAAAGNRIYAPASAYVGNVGTRGGRPNDPSIAADELSSGPYKLEGGSRFDQIRQLALTAESFLENVVNQRSHAQVNPLKITKEQLAEGRLYLGSEALALGLIDGEGARSEGIEAAAELAGLKDYALADLADYFNLAATPAPAKPKGTAQSLWTQAPPGAIYMLDSRIPLPETPMPERLRHLPAKSSSGDAVLSSVAGSVTGSGSDGPLQRFLGTPAAAAGEP